MHEQTSKQPSPLPSFAAPFLSAPMAIEPGWIDYNGHLNMAYYLVMFDRCVDQLWEQVGIGPAYRQERGLTTYSAEAHIRYLREVKADDRMIVSYQLVDFDEKRLHGYQEMRHAEEGWLAATCETMTLHVDQSGPRVAPMPADILARIEALAAAHDALPRPEGIGRPIGIRRRCAES